LGATSSLTGECTVVSFHNGSVHGRWSQSSSSESSWNTTLRRFTSLSLHEPGGARHASCLLVALGSFPFIVVSLPPPSSLLYRSVSFACSISASSRSLPVLVSFP
jgi:hypothetical protein